MNLSLRNRVTISFVVANLVVLVMVFVVFQHLSGLNNQIENLTNESMEVSIKTEEIRITAVSLLKAQRKILVGNRPSAEQVKKIIGLCEIFTEQLSYLEEFYRGPEVKRELTQLKSYVDSLKLILGKASLFYRDSVGVSSVEDLSNKILETFSELQNKQYEENQMRNRTFEKIIANTKKRMMIILIIGFFGLIVITLVLPVKLTLPFKKIKDAIRELQECNFDVSIYYDQDDEIGEIANEMNKMIRGLKVFEELRTDRISVENRKFDALANLTKKPVLLADALGHLIYMNNQTYKLLEVQSEDVIGKVMSEKLVPKSIMEGLQLAIKRRSKIENMEIAIYEKDSALHDTTEKKEEGSEEEHVNVGDDSTKAHGHSVKENEAPLAGQGDSEHQAHQEIEGPRTIYKGYANIIPIRGKESSLDYYLMVLSTEVFS